MMHLIDSYAWIEYFEGSEKGKKAGQFIESGNSITPSICVAEITEKYKSKGMLYDKYLNFIIAKTSIASLDLKTAVVAGEINVNLKKAVKDWGTADSIILATSKLLGLKIVTGDRHFKNMENVVFLG